MSNRLYSKDTMKKPLWYKVPRYASCQGWDKWRAEMQQDYPVQYFVRELVGDWAFSAKHAYRAIKCFFKPYHSDIRKAVPRQWADISRLIVDVNFAMILSFKKEADESYVDWNASEDQRKFKNWLDSVANWIKEGYPNLCKQLENSYPPEPLPEHLKGKSYDELYHETNRLLKLIEETNTNILKQMIDYREYMWT